MGVHIDIGDDTPFTIHNIPFGVISTTKDPRPRCATAIGRNVIDLNVFARLGRLNRISTDLNIYGAFSQVWAA